MEVANVSGGAILQIIQASHKEDLADFSSIGLSKTPLTTMPKSSASTSLLLRPRALLDSGQQILDVPTMRTESIE